MKGKENSHDDSPVGQDCNQFWMKQIDEGQEEAFCCQDKIWDKLSNEVVPTENIYSSAGQSGDKLAIIHRKQSKATIIYLRYNNTLHKKYNHITLMTQIWTML